MPLLRSLKIIVRGCTKFMIIVSSIAAVSLVTVAHKRLLYSSW